MAKPDRAGSRCGSCDAGGRLKRQPDDEAGVARFGFDIDRAAELLRHDAMNDLQAQAGAGTLRLGGEEGFEDVRQSLRGNACAVILDADGEPV